MSIYDWLPMPHFLVIENLYWGALAGFLLFGPTLYAYFYSTQAIGTERVLMVFAFCPLIALGWEWLASQFGFVTINRISTGDAISTAVIIAGALFMFVMRARRDALAARVPGADKKRLKAV